jgi:hypothetical protein
MRRVAKEGAIFNIGPPRAKDFDPIDIGGMGDIFFFG